MALVRGSVAELLETPIVPPEDVRLPAGAPELGRVAVALMDIEKLRPFERPLCVRHERVRSFWLRDATGRALVRFAAAAQGELELRLRRPFLQGHDSGREVYLRTVEIGEELVVAGQMYREVGAAGAMGTYRDAPTVAIIEAAMVCDRDAWEALQAWQALPWHRKLSLLMCNR